MKKAIITIILLIFAGVATYVVINMISFQKAWKVEITQDYINVRDDHSTNATKIDKVSKGKKYKVKEVYLDDQSYVWYKIEYKSHKTGWIASLRDEPYVIEINNPDHKDNSKEGVIDYNAPKLKFFEDVYSVYDINSISYNHLEVKDDSEYEITHEIYYEEHPKDTDIPQYWIKYTVTDSFGNKTSKLQKIEFTVEPSSEDVLIWEE